MALEQFKALIAMGVMEVRTDGTVWRLANRTNKGRLKPIPAQRVDIPSGNGYRMIPFSYEGKAYLISAHRLVYQVLVGPIPEGWDINHKDGVKHNNVPGNLEPATRSGNHLHAYREGLRKPAQAEIVSALGPRAKELRGQGLTFLQVAKELGCSQTTAFRAVHTKSTPG